MLDMRKNKFEPRALRVNKHKQLRREEKRREEKSGAQFLVDFTISRFTIGFTFAEQSFT